MINFEKLFASPTLAEDLARIVSISLTDMETTLANHPSLYTYAATTFALERAAEAQADAEVKRTKARVTRTLMEEGGKSATAVAAVLEANPEVIEATEKHLAHVARVVVLRALVDGLDHRREMLVNLAARTRRDR